MSRPKLTYIVTDARTAESFLSRTGQIRYFQQQGYEISLISNPSERLEEIGRKEGVAVYGIPLLRRISPWTDLKCLIQLTRLLLKIRPTIVNASTPKAGLLGMLASRIARVPIRIYLLRGLRAETTQGRTRKLLYACEQITSMCATQIVSVSQSLMETVKKLGVCDQSKLTVLGPGSSNGVQTSRFEQSNVKKGRSQIIRADLQIPQQDDVIGFVGRIAKDKGIDDLINAFGMLKAKSSREIHLLLVGDIEENDPPALETIRTIQESPQIHITGFVSNPHDYYGLCDLLAFPSYREGFPNVPLEAAAAGIPTVGYRATGVVDAVIDGETGLLVEKGNVSGFAESMQNYLDTPDLREEHGARGHKRVQLKFQPETIFQLWSDFYKTALQEKRLELPEPRQVVEAGEQIAKEIAA